MPKPNSAFRDLFVLNEEERRRLPHYECAVYLAHEEWPGDPHPAGQGPYVQGYLEATGLIWKSLEEADRANTLLYPALFLARHAVELALKEAIEKRRSRPVAGGRDDLWSTHNLAELAEQFRQIYAEDLGHWWSPYHDLMTKMEEADRGGFFFRYCRDKGGHLLDLGDARCLTASRVRDQLREAAQIIQGIASI